MKAIRDTATKFKLNLEDQWTKSIQPVQDLISDRFSRLKLKDEGFECVPTVTEEEMNYFQRHIADLFPGMDSKQLQKKHTNSISTYIRWKKTDCRETHYTFQVRKRDDNKCCAPLSRPVEELPWLPAPVQGMNVFLV